jgi:hypothetical protein
MLKLNYLITYTFTGADIGDTAAPGIEYTARCHRPDGWTQLVLDFIEKKLLDPTLAAKIISGVIVHLTYEGQVYPMDLETVKLWRDDIETNNPGLGDGYICKIATAIYVRQLDYENERLGNSKARSAPSRNGAGRAKSPMQVVSA